MVDIIPTTYSAKDIAGKLKLSSVNEVFMLYPDVAYEVWNYLNHKRFKMSIGDYYVNIWKTA